MRSKQLRHERKALILAHYGGRCSCCGEDEPEFLCVDHVENDGAAHRLSLFGNERQSGAAFYRWLVKSGFPPGFQLLCWNCNSSKHAGGGVCVHRRLELGAARTTSACIHGPGDEEKCGHPDCVGARGYGR